jgi:membrane associated rhomboid family serine protease
VAFAFVIVLAVAFALWYRGNSPEQREQYFKDAIDLLRRLKAAANERPENEAFRRMLRARMPRLTATPAIALLITAVFLGMLIDGKATSDPETLLAWGGNLGTRTTNGEWWRLVTSTFVHVGSLHLLVDVTVLIQLGMILERLVGRVTMAAVYLSAGLFDGLANLSSHPVTVTVGSSGAVFGLYGLLSAALIWQTFRGRREPLRFTIPAFAVKRLAVGAAVFLIYSATNGFAGAPEVVALLCGTMYGVILARHAGDEEPTPRQAGLVMLATAALVMFVAIAIGGITDVRPELARVVEVEKSTVATYQTSLDALKKGRLTADALAQLAERTIVADLQAADARLAALTDVPSAHQPLVDEAREFLRLRCASWRARAAEIRRTYGDRPRRPEGVEDMAWRLQLEQRFRADNAARGTAEAAERASMDALQRIGTF